MTINLVGLDGSIFGINVTQNWNTCYLVQRGGMVVAIFSEKYFPALLKVACAENHITPRPEYVIQVSDHYTIQVSLTPK